MQIIELKKQITSGKIKNTYLFTGDEQYLINNYIELIEKHLLDPQTASLNRDFFDECKDINRIIDSCMSFPMFSDNKLIIVKNSSFFTMKKESVEPLIKYVNSPCKTSCLVFWEEKIDKRNALYKAVASAGVFFEFEYRTPDELHKWIISILKRHNKTMDRDACIKLIFNCDNGMYELENELNKLLLYCSDRDCIKLSDVNNISIRSVKAGIFELTDAVTTGQTDIAYKKLYDLFYLKEPAFMIFFMISRQFMILNETINMKMTGFDLKQISQKTKTPDYITGKNVKNAEIYGLENIKKAISLINKIDIDIKSGNVTVDSGLDILIHSLSNKIFIL